MKRKILAVASGGGHWQQLLRITEAMHDDFELCYVCTRPDMASSVQGAAFHTISDFSRSGCFRIIPASFQAIRIIIRENPDAVITTGAAPGLVAVFVARLLRKRTVWIDSIANAARLSLSGRIASHFVSRTYTQWQDLETGRVLFAGNVFGW